MTIIAGDFQEDELLSWKFFFMKNREKIMKAKNKVRVFKV